MEITIELLAVLIGLVGTTGFVMGSMISPHNKVYKEEIKHWRSRCGSLEREAQKVEGIGGDFGDILQLLPEEWQKQLGGVGGIKGAGMLIKSLPNLLSSMTPQQPKPLNNLQTLG